MKIPFSTLLFAITVLHNFYGLNSSDSGEGSSRPHGGQNPQSYRSENLDTPIPVPHPSGSHYPAPSIQLPHSSGSQYPHPPFPNPHTSGSQYLHPPAPDPHTSGSQYLHPPAPDPHSSGSIYPHPPVPDPHPSSSQYQHSHVQHPHTSGSPYPYPPVQHPHTSGSHYPHPPAQHPHPSGRQHPHEEDPNLDPPTKTYVRGDRVIGVWRIPRKNKATNARLLGANTIPDHSYKYSHNYVSRAEYLDGIRVIVYIENEKVIGAELPPRTSGPTPNKSVWYINYSREDFRVKVHPRTGSVLSVSLNIGNFSPSKSYRQQFSVETVSVFMGGIRFFVDVETLSNGHRKILGAFAHPRED